MIKAKHKHLLHDASFLMMSLQGRKDEMNHFYCCVCQGKHSQAKTLKTTSLGNIEKAGMVRNIARGTTDPGYRIYNLNKFSGMSVLEHVQPLEEEIKIRTHHDKVCSV